MTSLTCLRPRHVSSSSYDVHVSSSSYVHTEGQNKPNDFPYLPPPSRVKMLDLIARPDRIIYELLGPDCFGFEHQTCMHASQVCMHAQVLTDKQPLVYQSWCSNTNSGCLSVNVLCLER